MMSYITDWLQCQNQQISNLDIVSHMSKCGDLQNIPIMLDKLPHRFVSCYLQTYLCPVCCNNEHKHGDDYLQT